LGTRQALAGVNVHSIHAGQINHQAVIARAEAGAVMPSTTYRKWQISLLSKFKATGDIRRAGAVED
jgi:hypothetical protein